MAVRYSTEEHAQADLVHRLQSDFITFEEVEVVPASFPDRVLRPDVIAIPRNEEYSDFLIAIEVKVGNPKGTGDYARYLKQGADYVLGKRHVSPWST